jgi:Tol biopolymer transport system component
MPIPAGTRIGAYEVIESLGAGGMGEVYRARDSRLDRDVAIKILPEAFAHDADRLARFEREAKTLAALNHPHIAAIYGVEEGGGVLGLVLELVDGPTLAGRIAQGAIPIDEALPIALQIIDALEAAHEAGIIHRDLKPANIKLRADGTVKVLDFGLAKLASDPSATSVLGVLSLSPTITSPAATGVGILLGTAAYMAPEQARGRAVDKRADIWAFGCVLFEMLTGHRPFEGEDVTETVGAVIHKEPAWNALPPDLPPHARLTLQRCVEKNPKQRFRDIGDVRLALEGAFNPPAAAPPVLTGKRVTWRGALPFAAAAIAAGVVAGLGVWAVARRTDPPPAPSRFTLTLPASDQLPAATGTLVGISHDGRTVLYRARRAGTFGLYRRSLNQFDAVSIGDADASESVFFSPDDQWIGFFVAGVLKKVPVAGGPSQTISTFPVTSRGASWGRDGTIVVGERSNGLMQVSAAGGTPMLLGRKPEQGREYWYPQILPDGRAVVYTASANSPDSGQIELLRLDTGEQRSLLPGSAGRVLPTGHLVFLRGGALWAVRFDLDRLAVVGTPALVAEGVRVEVGGAVQYAVSDDGTLVYVPGTSVVVPAANLAWVDRSGREELVKAPPRAYYTSRVSPDGTRAAIDIRDQDNDIWIWNFGRQTLTRLTFDPGNDFYPIWTADGQRIAFASSREQVLSPFWQAADGTGTAQRLATATTLLDQPSLSPDGKRMVLRNLTGGGGEDIVMLSMEGERRIEPLIHTPFRERNAEISPDGRWIAYQSNESGGDQVYVRPFPAVDSGRWQVSATGGQKPFWARNGRELFYTANDGSLMSVPIQGPGAAFNFGNAARLFDASPYNGLGLIGRTVDASPDGKRFLMIKSVKQEETLAQINVVLNWFDELKQKVPVR